MTRSPSSFHFIALTLAFSVGALAWGITTPARAANEVYSTGIRCNNKADSSREFSKDRYVYFDTNSSRLREVDLPKIKYVYDMAKGRSAQQICLFGKASKVGGASGNDALGIKRARNVAQELERLGWPRSKIVIGTEGEAWGWLEDMLTNDAEEDRRVLMRLSM
ncbi:MAG: OmpA family protein [Parvibaculum sp.]|nr:OmpA family protein [Parvibaculum sp.]